MEVTGKIKFIGETKTVGTNSFKKRELVVTTEEQYPQHILIEFVQDRCDLLERYSAGQPVVVSINLRGREWTNSQGETKYFNSIQGWKIAPQGQETQNNNQYSAQNSFEAGSSKAKSSYNDTTAEDDDLPF